MKSTFSRALIGFIVLTLAVVCMALAALWAVEAYLPNHQWTGALVVLFTLTIQIAIFNSTLSKPIMNWINEPKTGS